MDSSNLAAEITQFVSTQNDSGQVEARAIYSHFTKKGYRQGQISGVLTRLKSSGRIVSPRRGIYENTNHDNVLIELRQDVAALVAKYDTQIPITIFSAMDDESKHTYEAAIKGLTQVLSSMQ